MKSLIVPVYRNEENLTELLEALAQISASVGDDFEAVLVVDGSPDRCAEILQARLASAGHPSRLLIHSRNYGSFAAIRTGLAAASPGSFAVMAADLQEPPELVCEFFRILDEDEADVVVGTRSARRDPWLSRIASGLFWRAYRASVNREIPAGGVDVFGCNEVFRNHLLKLGEAHTSLVGLIYWLGFRRQEVPYERRERQKGSSAWTLGRRIEYLLDSLFAFTDLPIRMLLAVGTLGLAVSAFFGILVVVLRLGVGFSVPGYAATILTILFFGALNVIGIGIVGAYVYRAFVNTQGRPLAVVMSQHRYGEADGSADPQPEPPSAGPVRS